MKYTTSASNKQHVVLHYLTQDSNHNIITEPLMNIMANTLASLWTALLEIGGQQLCNIQDLTSFSINKEEHNTAL